MQFNEEELIKIQKAWDRIYKTYHKIEFKHFCEEQDSEITELGFKHICFDLGIVNLYFESKKPIQLKLF